MRSHQSAALAALRRRRELVLTTVASSSVRRRVTRFLSTSLRSPLAAAMLFALVRLSATAQMAGLVDGSALRPGSIEGMVDQAPSGRALANVLVTIAATLQT